MSLMSQCLHKRGVIVQLMVDDLPQSVPTPTIPSARPDPWSEVMGGEINE